MEKKINPILKRLSEFAESKGGFAEIGRRIKKHPSMFYNLVRRDAVPSLNTLTDIAEAFPELDLNYLIRGVASSAVEVETMNKLRREVQMKQATIDVLTSAAHKTIDQPVTSFHKGASITPQDKPWSGIRETLGQVVQAGISKTAVNNLNSRWTRVSIV